MFESNFYGGNGSTILEIITYHALALGFIASTFTDSKNTLGKERQAEIFNTGITTVSTYMIQAIVGMGFTILLSKFIKNVAVFYLIKQFERLFAPRYGANKYIFARRRGA